MSIKNKPLPSIQRTIIEASHDLDIPTTEGGICNGFATMAIFADLGDRLDAFEAQIWEIHDLGDAIQTAASEALNRIEPFLWTLNIAQRPSYYDERPSSEGSDAFKSSEPRYAIPIGESAYTSDWIRQDVIKAYTHLMPDVAVSVPLYNARSTYSFTDRDLLEWSNAMYQVADMHENKHLECMLVASSHAIALIYDVAHNNPAQHVWRMLDANGSVDLSSPFEMKRAVMSHTWQYDGEVTFACQWIADEQEAWFGPMVDEPLFLEHSLLHPEIEDASHNPALWLAAYTGDTNFLEAYFNNTALCTDPDFSTYLNHPSKSGWTPLCVSITLDAPQACQLLLDAGADVELMAPIGYSPLIYAMYFQKTDCVHALLEHGADPMRTDGAGYTPLHLACQYGNIDVALALIEYGASLDVMAYCGDTPWSLAKAYGQDALLAALSAA